MASRTAAAIATVVTALVLAGIAPAATAVGKLTATDGPGFTITMSKKAVPHGVYVITVKDRSAIHNFHLSGPGVNKKTSIGRQQKLTWKLKFKKGKTYAFRCDSHPATMKGSFKAALKAHFGGQRTAETGIYLDGENCVTNEPPAAT